MSSILSSFQSKILAKNLESLSFPQNQLGPTPACEDHPASAKLLLTPPRAKVEQPLRAFSSLESQGYHTLQKVDIRAESTRNTGLSVCTTNRIPTKPKRIPLREQFDRDEMLEVISKFVSSSVTKTSEAVQADTRPIPRRQEVPKSTYLTTASKRPEFPPRIS